MSKNLIIEFAKENQEVQFEQPITGVSIDGQKLSDVHDLAQKVVKMTKTIKVLAFTATSLVLMAVIAIAYLGTWLISNDSSIQRLLLTSSKDYDTHMFHAEKWRSHERQRAYIHLQEFHGLHWDEGMQDWVNHAMVKYNKKRK